jgi:hypothetical protein
MGSLRPLAPALALFAAASVARAEPPGMRPTEYSASHPFALGARVVGRVGEYAMAGLGGQVRLRPHRLVAIELYSDQFIGDMNGALRHDHEVGGSVQFTGLGTQRWTVYPLLGACAMLVMVHPPQSGAPAVHDIHFGVHGGAGAEIHVQGGLTLQAQLEGIGYVGHAVQVYRWSAEVSPDLRISGVGQLMLGANYYF